MPAVQYRCPNCKSGRMAKRGLYIVCLACKKYEPLYDYPMSWMFWRELNIKAGLPDPGPDEPVNLRIEDLEARITYLEELEPAHPETMKSTREELQKLKAYVLYLQNKFDSNVKVKPLSKQKKYEPGKPLI